jgi:hypothetical protein
MLRVALGFVFSIACSKTEPAKRAPDPVPATPTPTAPTPTKPAAPGEPLAGNGPLPPLPDPDGADPVAPGEPAAKPAAQDDSPTALCTRSCKKALQCLGAGDDQMPDCVAGCTAHSPERAKVEQLEAADCDAVIAFLKGGGGGAAPAAGKCTADCRGCMGDGNSCWAAAGGTNGIPCDGCCCAPGGGARVWR